MGMKKKLVMGQEEPHHLPLFRPLRGGQEEPGKKSLFWPFRGGQEEPQTGDYNDSRSSEGGIRRNLELKGGILPPAVRGQASMELITITTLILLLVVGMMQTAVQINNMTGAIAVAKAQGILEIQKSSSLPYLVYLVDVVPSNVTLGTNKVTLELKLGGVPPGKTLQDPALAQLAGDIKNAVESQFGESAPLKGKLFSVAEVKVCNNNDSLGLDCA